MTSTRDKRQDQELTLRELLILSALWMLFGFVLWYYLSVFHVVPARLAAESILEQMLGSDFRQIVAAPDERFIYLVETNIPFTFADGTTEALGFLINPLIFSYGLPLLFGLVMGSNVGWRRKLTILLVGYAVITGVQIWGVVWQALKQLVFDFGDQTHVIVQSHNIPDTLVALCYQLGTLILPALAPIFVWVLGNRKLVEQFVGWGAGQSTRDEEPEYRNP